jgi:hypothetical protein
MGRQEAPYLLLPDAECPAPCWQSIRPPLPSPQKRDLSHLPGWHQVNEFSGTFSINGHAVGVQYDGAIVLMPERVRLGHLVVVLGKPDYVASNPTEHHWFYEMEQLIVVLPQERLTPHTLVVRLIYPAEYFARPAYAYAWDGW